MKRQSNVCCPASLNKFKFRKERCHSRFRSYKMRCRMVIISLMLTVFFGQHQLARAMPTERPVSTSDAPRALFVIHRHGERTLAATFSGDPLNNVTIWPDGLSQITLDGRRRMYRLGQFLHQKYEATIGENPKRVYVRSSGIDRCLESVQMVAHAMYPPKGRWNWNTAETWQPISVYTVYKPNDGMLNPGAHCPAAKMEEHAILNGELGRGYTEKFAWLMAFLSDKLGFEVNDLFTAKAVYDSISTARVNQKPVPEWVDDNVWTQLSQLYDASFEVEFSSRRQQRLRTGVLLHELRSRLLSLVSAPPAQQQWTGIRWDVVDDRHKNVFIYSTHDSMIAALLSALRVFDNQAPPFGASILLEVFGPTPNERAPQGQAGPDNDSESVAQQTVIRIGYLKYTDSKEIQYLQLANCDSQYEHKPSCTLNQFLNAIDDLQMPLDKWKLECNQS